MVGLEILEANVEAARENVSRNGLKGKIDILLSDSYAPIHDADSAKLDDFQGKVDFIVANPTNKARGMTALDTEERFSEEAENSWRRNGVVFLSVSYQYGLPRVHGAL